MELKVDLKLQRISVWCGIGALAVFGLAFGLLAGLIPPLTPTASAQQITDVLIQHKLRIRLGLALSVVSAPFFMPFLAALCIRLREIEGRWGILTATQMMAAVVFVPGFIFPMMVLGTATFRPEQRSPELTQTLNDIFWLMFVGIVGTLIVQAIVIVIAVFVDRRERPVLPRWYGYLNGWYMVLAAPGGAVLLFNDGPLSWSGVFAFWIPLVAFSAWIVGSVVAILQSISAQQAAEQEGIAA